MATRNIVPRATGEGTIGTAVKKWLGGWINALVVVTVNGLTLTAAAVGFTISGGTTSKTLTVPLDATVSGTNTGDVSAASQADMEAGSSTTVFVSPGRQHFHPSAAKGWGKAAGAGSLTTGYNMDAVTDTGVGRLGVNITTDISSANYAIVTSLSSVATTLTVATVDNGGLIYNASQAVGAFGIWNYDDTATTHVAQDPESYFWAIFGDI